MVFKRKREKMPFSPAHQGRKEAEIKGKFYGQEEQILVIRPDHPSILSLQNLGFVSRSQRLFFFLMSCDGNLLWLQIFKFYFCHLSSTFLLCSSFSFSTLCSVSYIHYFMNIVFIEHHVLQTPQAQKTEWQRVPTLSLPLFLLPPRFTPESTWLHFYLTLAQPTIIPSLPAPYA